MYCVCIVILNLFQDLHFVLPATWFAHSELYVVIPEC
jgi:hypothetical protein